MRDSRRVGEAEIAAALCLVYAEDHINWFSMMGYYDNDADFIAAVAERVGATNSVAFTAKMTRVVRRLVQYGVLVAQMHGTHKEYFGEPSKQMEYQMKAGKASLIQRGKTEHTMTAAGEVRFLLRHAYPQQEQA